jgi:hypothetical protein
LEGFIQTQIKSVKLTERRNDYYTGCQGLADAMQLLFSLFGS